ncbi:MAG: hypothetical protein KIT32_12160 [Rhodocyclaceae bacterium]|nr:hypothetical protein [Rhodocyclaceae bacterium]
MKQMSVETQAAVVDELEWCGAFMDAMNIWLGTGMPFTKTMKADLEERVAATRNALAKARAEMGE